MRVKDGCETGSAAIQGADFEVSLHVTRVYARIITYSSTVGWRCGAQVSRPISFSLVKFFLGVSFVTLLREGSDGGARRRDVPWDATAASCEARSAGRRILYLVLETQRGDFAWNAPPPLPGVAGMLKLGAKPRAARLCFGQKRKSMLRNTQHWARDRQERCWPPRTRTAERMRCLCVSPRALLKEEASARSQQPRQ